MDFINAAELLELCRKHNTSISDVMMRREIELLDASQQDITERLTHSLEIMRNGVQSALPGNLRSMGGLIGGESAKMRAFYESGRSILGSVMSRAVTYGLAVLEVNASMGLIVAAPTAGASGVLPGVLLAYGEEYGFTDRQLISALLNSSAIGYLSMRNATISGAKGGCQAEVGVASMMAASALCELFEGEPEVCLNAASIAMGNLLGLVCDPVAGLVEEPCQKRNAIGVGNAVIAAELSLAGVINRVSLDDMLDAMNGVARGMPFELRESGIGGIAGTKSGQALRDIAMGKDT